MSNLRIAELDFDQIKTNLKNYLKAQDEFTDYDFEGSGLSVLLDVLAYNTHYNAYLANMVVNEMFLDSAVKRSSAVSIAKHLGYTPSSVRGAKAVLDVTVNNPAGLPQILTMERYTQFTSTVNGTTYTFSTNQDYTAVRNDNSYLFENVEVVEGSYKSFSFAVRGTTPDAKYPQDIMFQTVNDKMAILDSIGAGQEVEVSFNLRGREFNGRYYNTLDAWKVQTTGAAPSVQPQAETDDLPF